MTPMARHAAPTRLAHISAFHGLYTLQKAAKIVQKAAKIMLPNEIELTEMSTAGMAIKGAAHHSKHFLLVIDCWMPKSRAKKNQMHVNVAPMERLPSNPLVPNKVSGREGKSIGASWSKIKNRACKRPPKKRPRAMGRRIRCH